jgi:hypothetical protein
MLNILTTECFKKKYQIRRTGNKLQNFIVSIPPEVILHEAEKHGVTIERFVAEFGCEVAYSSGVSGLMYAFVKLDKAKELPGTVKENLIANHYIPEEMTNA